MPTPEGRRDSEAYYEKSVTREHVAEDMFEASAELESLHDELFTDLGVEEQPARDGESADEAKKLAAEHGEDYHGFGHPPNPPSD